MFSDLIKEKKPKYILIPKKIINLKNKAKNINFKCNFNNEGYCNKNRGIAINASKCCCNSCKVKLGYFFDSAELKFCEVIKERINEYDTVWNNVSFHMN